MEIYTIIYTIIVSMNIKQVSFVNVGLFFGKIFLWEQRYGEAIAGLV